MSMSSLRRVSSLTSGLLARPGHVPSNLGSGAITSASVHYRKFKNGDRKKDDYEFGEEESNKAGINNGTVKGKESLATNKFRPVTGVISSNVKKVDTSNSASAAIDITRGHKRLPWHSLLSFLKPNIGIQPLRYSSNVCGFEDSKKSDACDLSKSDECKPQSTSTDLPITCVKVEKPPQPPCKIPEQKKWCCCDKYMCLPCCCPVEKPLKCKKFDVRLNICPRKTYRIAAYSECSKRYGRKQYRKECCYVKRICYARNMADREIKPLLHIKDRQALVLGFGVKATCDSAT